MIARNGEETKLVVTVTLSKDGLYDESFLLNQTEVLCPLTADNDCEAFAVQDDQLLWHQVTSIAARGGRQLELTVQDWTLGQKVLATRAMYSNWPLVLVRNVAGIPLLPWWEETVEMLPEVVRRVGGGDANNNNAPVIGLVLALYNANVTTDWVQVSRANIPIRAIVPVPGVVPPDPGWVPEYPTPDAYRKGVEMLRTSGVEVYAYTHLRNLSKPCCTCCGNITEFQEWIDVIQSAATYDGVMMDNNDAPWSSTGENPDGLVNMYRPAAAIVKKRGLGVWANGPHVSKNGTIHANASEWSKYLEYSTFTTLFEMPVDDWLAYPKDENFSKRLEIPSSELGGYVLDIPDDPMLAASAIEKSLEAAVARGLKWLYPTIKCQHRTGSCTYANLPSYWTTLVEIIEKMNSRTQLLYRR
jgi:hypothetical protein